MTKPDEPVLYYLQDGPQRGFVREELLVVPFDTQLPMGCSGVENRSPSSPVALETRQPYVIMSMPYRIVQPVDAELLSIFRVISPKELDVASSTVVILSLSEMQNVVDLQIKPKPLDLVLPLVGY